MSKSLSLETSLMLAGLLAFSAAQSADNMSRDDYNARKDQIEAMYKADRAACDRLSGNTKDVCVEQAKGKQKIARAELDAARSGKESDRGKVAEARAEASYAVAKERCDDMAGNAKDVCMKDAKAAETQARTNAKANRESSEARAEARADQRDAGYEAARERCDSLAGDAKESCVDAAKRQYGKK